MTILRAILLIIGTSDTRSSLVASFVPSRASAPRSLDLFTRDRVLYYCRNETAAARTPPASPRLTPVNAVTRIMARTRHFYVVCITFVRR